MANDRDDRTPQRSHEERKTAGERPNTWRPPGALPDPNPRDGYVHRWVRLGWGAQTDDQNVYQRRAEGWEFCKPEDYPEVVKLVPPDTAKGLIRVGNVALAKAPVEMMEQRKEYYATQTRQGILAVENDYLRQSDRRMPVLKPNVHEIPGGRRNRSK
jgi:hypothetical protein